MTDDIDSQGNKTITRLMNTEGVTRTYELSDGSYQERVGGTASWRHNNPGNLKVEYANSADSTVHTNRTKEHALASAQSIYKGVIDLDQRGNLIFDTFDHGRDAQKQFINNDKNSGKTVAEMLGNYSKPDYSGPTHYGAQEASIYATGDAEGVDLRTKKIQDMSPQEMNALADGISKFEGWREGKSNPLTAQQTAERQTHPQQSSTKTLQLGAHGEAVITVQTDLGALGYFNDSHGQPLQPNGHFGPATKAAVVAFQHDAGLPAHGIAGPKTLEAIHEQRQSQLAMPEFPAPVLPNLSPLPSFDARDVQKALGVAELPQVAPALLNDPRNPGHPDHAMNQNVRDQVRGIYAEQGAPLSDQQLDRTTAAVMADARRSGLTEVTALRFSEDYATGKPDLNGNIFAFQGSDPTRPGSNWSMTHTQQAATTPPEASYQQFAQVTQQQAQVDMQFQAQQTRANAQEQLAGPGPGGPNMGGPGVGRP